MRVHQHVPLAFCENSTLHAQQNSWADALKYRPGSLIVLCPAGAGEAPGQLMEVNVVGKGAQRALDTSFFLSVPVRVLNLVILDAQEV